MGLSVLKNINFLKSFGEISSGWQLLKRILRDGWPPLPRKTFSLLYMYTAGDKHANVLLNISLGENFLLRLQLLPSIMDAEKYLPGTTADCM
jgi:hypothetical protein